MKNRITLLLAISVAGIAQAQVGFNTSTPKATLDIVAKTATGTSTSPEGLLVPRVDRQKAQSMTGVTASTMIYVNSIATGAAAGTAININAVGYYYFDGSAWIKINTGNSADTNIYNKNGSLTENRIVTQDANTLAFNSTAVNGFSVDGTTLSVDAANNRLGIGTAAPNSTLQVLGGEMRVGGPASQTGSIANPVLRIHSNANTDGSGGELRFSENASDFGYYLRHNTDPGVKYGYDGLAIGAAQTGKYDYSPARPGVFISDSQNVGLGTATPQQMFHVDGSRDNNINTTPTDAQQSNDVVIRSNGNMGIGTVNPNNKLDLGTSQGKKLAIWNNVAGDDFYGLGAAQNVMQLFVGVPTDGNALMTLNKNGRVGVGTVNPQANFHTIGTRRFENATTGSVAVGSVLTATDTNGTAEWKSPATTVALGGTETGTIGVDIPFQTDGTMKYTGRFVTLPPGKWIVTITQLAQTSGNLNADDWMFVRSTFSEQNLAVGAAGVQSPNVNGGPSLMSFRVQGPGSAGSPQQFDVFQGSIFINNNTNANKTYRYIVGGTVKGGGNTPAGTVIKSFGGTWSESSVYATAIN
ncbi:hypothetical protein [Chryseobacterium sp. ERMR1:04]|uniref:hypothetical protein n=1 Tax=Chryseobacterium sp. ERMR1:04 TaxID=1705393 RepID=UPI000A749AB7|nr:hypothetical protein [Chryseobacterium sp. ERMR1:04]